MPLPERQRFPEWAERERAGDLAWIQDNLPVLWQAAKRTYMEEGRGAIFIDTLTTTPHAGGSGNPMFYLNEQVIEQTEQHSDALRMVRAYEPSSELVTVLVKKGRESTYRVGVPFARKPVVSP